MCSANKSDGLRSIPFECIICFGMGSCTAVYKRVFEFEYFSFCNVKMSYFKLDPSQTSVIGRFAPKSGFSL